MSDTKQFTMREFQMTGPAVLCAYDVMNDYLYRLGKCDNIRVRRETDNVYQSEIHIGRNVGIDARTVGERWFINFSMMERLNPDWSRLIMKNCGTPIVFPTCSLLTVTEEMRMYRDHAQVLHYSSGFWGDGMLPAPTNGAAVAGGAGGTIPGGTYVIVIEAVYTDANGKNPVRSEYTNSAGVPVVLGQELTVTWDPPAGGVTPSYYNIYEYDTVLGETRADADLIAVVLSTGPTAIIFDSFTDYGDWPGDTTGPAFAITDINGNPYDAGDDYTIDTTCGRLSLVEDGDILDGTLILVTYTYIANPFYTQSLGPGDRNPRCLYLVIIWLKEDDRSTPAGRGAELHFPHVHAESGFEWNFDQMDFESGFDQEYRILLDSGTGQYGTIYTFHRFLADWELKDIGAMSSCTSEDPCPIISS